MKSLKEMLLSGLFVVMGATLLIACGGSEEASTDGGGDGAAAVVAPATTDEGSDGGAMENMVKTGKETIQAAEDIKADAEDEDWFPEEEVKSGSEANQ